MCVKKYCHQIQSTLSQWQFKKLPNVMQQRTSREPHHKKCIKSGNCFGDKQEISSLYTISSCSSIEGPYECKSLANQCKSDTSSEVTEREWSYQQKNVTIRRLPRDVAAELHARVYHRRFFSNNANNNVEYVKSTSYKSSHNPNTITPAQNIPIGELEESYWAKWKPHKGTVIDDTPQYISVHRNVKPQIHLVPNNDRNLNKNNHAVENNREAEVSRKPAVVYESNCNEIGLVQRLREKFDNMEQNWNEVPVCPYCRQFKNVSPNSNQINDKMVSKYSFGERKVVFDEAQNSDDGAKFDNSVTLVSSKENFDNKQNINCESLEEVLEENVIEDDRCSCRSLWTQNANAESKQKNANDEEEIKMKHEMGEENIKDNEVEHFVIAAEGKTAIEEPLQTISLESNQNCESILKDSSFSSDDKNICFVSEYNVYPTLDSKITDTNAIESTEAHLNYDTLETTGDDKINNCTISQTFENKNSILRQNCNDKSERPDNLQPNISNLNNNLLPGSGSSVWAHSYPLRTSKKQQVKVTGHRNGSNSKSLPMKLRQPSYLRK